MTRRAGGEGPRAEVRARRGPARAIPFALLALLVPSAPAPAQPAADCARHAGEFPALVGRSEAAVRAALAVMPGIRTIRAAAPGAALTQDYRADRATLLVERGLVLRITCG